MSEIRKQTIDGLKKGDTFCVTRRFSEQEVQQYADITRDFNPIHFDERFSKAKKFSSRICQGLLAASLLTEIGGQIGWLASKMDFRFIKPVYFDDTITCHLTITAIDDRNRAEARAIYRNQHDNIVLEAFLSGILPDLGERKILQTMVNEGDPTNKIG